MYFIAYDLGTGGVKASLYDWKLTALAKTFIEYKTLYPAPNHHEQRLSDWWQAVVESTKSLLGQSGISAAEIACVALSGHSLVAIPLDDKGEPLLEQVPIWSDTRADAEAADFFTRVNHDQWYLTTGNGFPPACYSIFKLMWLKKHSPALFEKTRTVIGSKDYINYKLTGNLYTDASYASGTGAYSLRDGGMNREFLEAAGLREDLFPSIVPSHTLIGRINEQAARETGLTVGTGVACGGVDNACMALGAVGSGEGKMFASLGSSSWVPVNSRKPVLDKVKRPYVFAHIEENMFTSAFSIFAGGSAFRWARDVLCRDIADMTDAYNQISEMAQTAPIGAGGIFFNPSLAGGTSQDKSFNIRGAFIGLHLGTTREEMMRSVMEGIALNLKNSVDYLQSHTGSADQIRFCGGGSKSAFWMQMFADVFGMEVIKSSIDQDAASLGAAAIAARAVGLWKDYSNIPALHHIERISRPNEENHGVYKVLLARFNLISDRLSDLGDELACFEKTNTGRE